MLPIVAQGKPYCYKMQKGQDLNHPVPLATLYVMPGAGLITVRFIRAYTTSRACRLTLYKGRSRRGIGTKGYRHFNTDKL